MTHSADQTQRERLARIEAPEPIEWRTSDGTIPIFRCGLCDRPTPMLVDGLGFDCCSPGPEQHLGVEWHSSETVEPREIRITLRDVLATFGIFSMLAIAAVGFMAVGG